MNDHNHQNYTIITTHIVIDDVYGAVVNLIDIPNLQASQQQTTVLQRHTNIQIKLN